MQEELATIAGEPHGDVLIITLTGEIDLSNAAMLEDAAHAMVGSEPVVLLDLGGVEYMDSAGLGLIQRLYSRLADVGTELRVLTPAGTAAYDLLRFTGIDVPIDVERPGPPSPP